jgi:hypothetical protein
MLAVLFISHYLYILLIGKSQYLFDCDATDMRVQSVHPGKWFNMYQFINNKFGLNDMPFYITRQAAATSYHLAQTIKPDLQDFGEDSWQNSFFTFI